MIPDPLMFTGKVTISHKVSKWEWFVLNIKCVGVASWICSIRDPQKWVGWTKDSFMLIEIIDSDYLGPEFYVLYLR